MEAHYKSCTGEVIDGDFVPCPICKVRFKTFPIMERHKIKTHPENNEAAKLTGFENSFAAFLKSPNGTVVQSDHISTNISAPITNNSESKFENEQVKISKIIANSPSTSVFSEPTTSSNEIIEYICSHCNLGFATDGDLLKHIRKVHEGEKKVGNNKCKYCDKIYLVPSELKAHIKSVHLNLTVKCYFCDDLFSRSDINKHVRNVHMDHIRQNVNNLSTEENKKTTKEEGKTREIDFTEKDFSTNLSSPKTKIAETRFENEKGGEISKITDHQEILKIPKTNMSASKTNQKSKYVINEHGKLVKLKSPISPKSLKFQFHQKNSKKISKLSLDSPIPSSVLRKTNQKSFINEQGKLEKLNSPISKITDSQNSGVLSEEMPSNSNETGTIPSEIISEQSISKIIAPILRQTSNQKSPKTKHKQRFVINEQGKLVKLKWKKPRIELTPVLSNELIQPDTENEVLEIEDDLTIIRKSESNSNPDRIEFESRSASPEAPKLEEPIQYVTDNDQTFRQVLKCFSKKKSLFLILQDTVD